MSDKKDNVVNLFGDRVPKMVNLDAQELMDETAIVEINLDDGTFIGEPSYDELLEIMEIVNTEIEEMQQYYMRFVYQMPPMILKSTEQTIEKARIARSVMQEKLEQLRNT
jgi:hypothetical protein